MSGRPARLELRRSSNSVEAAAISMTGAGWTSVTSTDGVGLGVADGVSAALADGGGPDANGPVGVGEDAGPP